MLIKSSKNSQSMHDLLDSNQAKSKVGILDILSNDRNEEKIEETRHKAGINPSSSTLKIPVINDKQIQKA